MIARVLSFLTTLARQAVPLGGIFGRDWQPVTAIAVYWLESLLLALAAVAFCALAKRRTSPAVAEELRAAGDVEGVRALEAERQAAGAAGIEPGDVATVHVGSMLIFGIFVALVLTVIVSKGHLQQGFEWREVRDGALAMIVVVAVGFMIDLWRFPAMPIAAVQARVNACWARWGLFWLLGFVGIGLMLITGRAAIFLGLFAGLKFTFEMWATLARTFGWRSLKDRQEAESLAGRH